MKSCLRHLSSLRRLDKYMYYATWWMLFIICGTDKILVFIYVLSLTCGDKTMFLYLHQLQDWEKCVCGGGRGGGRGWVWVLGSKRLFSWRGPEHTAASFLWHYNLTLVCQSSMFCTLYYLDASLKQHTFHPNNVKFKVKVVLMIFFALVQLMVTLVMHHKAKKNISSEINIMVSQQFLNLGSIKNTYLSNI